MSGNITFDPVRHRYELDGQWLPGVTTIIGVLAKPHLIAWAANEAVDYIEKNAYREALSQEDYQYNVTPVVLDEARTAHVRKRDKAADKGTNVHSIAETWIRHCIAEMNGETDITGIPKTWEPILPLILWAREHKIRFLDCEVMVCSELHGYAGRFDQDGKRYIGDIKTGKGVYPEFFIQMGGYEIAYQEKTWQAVDGRVILHLNSKTLTPHVSTDYSRDAGAFLHCLALYKAMKTFPDLNPYAK